MTYVQLPQEELDQLDPLCGKPGMDKLTPRIPLLPSYLMGAHLVDFTSREMRWGLSNSGSILYRFIEGQQGEAELFLEQGEIKHRAVNAKGPGLA